MARGQVSIPGTDHDKITVIDEMAERYEESRDAWIKCGTAMRADLARLMAEMKAHKLKVYTTSDGSLSVTIVVEQEKLKVKRLKASDANDGIVSVGDEDAEDAADAADAADAEGDEGHDDADAEGIAEVGAVEAAAGVAVTSAPKKRGGKKGAKGRKPRAKK